MGDLGVVGEDVSDDAGDEGSEVGGRAAATSHPDDGGGDEIVAGEV